MNKSDITIRNERADEERVTEKIVRDSFWNVYRPGCTEHYVLHCLRKDPDFVPELNFVILKNNRIIGQTVFVKTALKLDDGSMKPILTMGPICIEPAYKGKGYGKMLLEYALQQAEKLGFGAVCFEGDIGFYGKIGFVSAHTKGIRYQGMPEGEIADFFLCKELQKNYLQNICGEYATPKSYFAAEENQGAFMAFDAMFPKKEKLVLPGQLFRE